MQRFTLTYPARGTAGRRAHIGVVASGDLEVLVTPKAGATSATVTVRTSVDGFETIWRRVLDRHFANAALAADYEVNDFGATPGTVSLRLAQATELAQEGDDS